jgi:HlyD family secretion protein
VGTISETIAYTEINETPEYQLHMKKIILIVVAVLVAAGLVSLFIYRQQSGYTKVLTAKITRHDLATVVSGTGQIKAQTYVNLGATAMGRVTHLYVKEGDTVKKGETVATIEHVQQEANVAGQQATISAAKTDIASYVAAEKTAEANVEHAKADLEQKQLDWQRAQALYQDGIMAKQDFDAKKAAYDLDVASLDQAVASLNQAKAQTDSQRGHLQSDVASLRYNQDLLDRTIAVAPFDGIVTNEPIREGETVVEGIQNAEGSTLMTLADMSVVTAEVKVDETDIVNIQIGQPADVTVDALPGKVFKGHVTLVGDQALLRSTGVATSQSTTGTEEAKDFKVVVTLDTPSNDLRPGLSTTAKITTAHKSDVLSLPIQALTMHDPASDNKSGSDGVQAASSADPASAGAPVEGVYVVDKDDRGKLRAKFVPVTTGITGATDIEVLSGLSEGQEVVTGPYKTLRALKNNALVKRDTTKQVVLSSSGSS